MNLIKLITPKNLAEERQKFLQDASYNPVFAYDWKDYSYETTSPTNKSRLIEAIVRQDIPSIVAYAKLVFEINDWSDLETATKIVAQIPAKPPTQTTADFVKAFADAIEYLNLTGYTVRVVSDEGFNFRPVVKEKKIYMSKHANFQFFEAEGEVRHELVHVIRYENGKFNQISKSTNYLPTEEGLATLMQDTGKYGKASEFQHAAEYIASRVGLEGSLRDIFNYFVGIGFTKELAWQRASRHKFGFVDTRVPGDILKPAMYFSNSLKIKKLSKEEKLRLFVGKIALSEVDNYSDYTGIVDPLKLDKFYNLS